MAYTEPKTETPPPAQTAQGRYEQLVTDRSPYETRAREVAALTIPALIPPQGSNGVTNLPTPWQSVGARGINNLAAKLLLALFPPGSAFFKLTVDEAILDELKGQQGSEDVVGEMEKALSKIERSVVKQMESTNVRAVMFEVFKHLPAAGNALLVVLPDTSFKFFPLTQYVVKRDLSGNPVEILTKEGLSRRTLPPAAREVVERHSSEDAYNDPAKSLDLYTCVTRKDNGSWRVHQEICGERIPGTEGFYPAGKSAWLPLRWTAVPGEDYGRGHGEEYLGDLYSLDSLSQSLVDGAAACAKVLILVDEAGVTSKKTIAESPNLAVRDGNAKDVSILQMEKMADFSVAQAQAAKIEQRLEQAFLLTSSIQRDAERVTAEEIRIMAAELEQALGGVYSMFAQELQRPLVERVLFLMQRSGKLPHFPEKSVTPQIVTGLEGLGRTSDLTRLDIFLQGIGEMFGQTAVAEYVNVGVYMKRRGAALSIDLDGLVRSEEDVQATRQQAMQAQLAAQLGPKAIEANAKRDIAATRAESSGPAPTP